MEKSGADRNGWFFQNIGISPGEWATKLLGRAPDVAATKVDSTAEMVTKFAAAHPRFEVLSEDIVFFLDTGRANDLAEAYSLAERFSSSTASESLPDGFARSDAGTWFGSHGRRTNHRRREKVDERLVGRRHLLALRSIALTGFVICYA
jgi:hypothetical protein